jgi:hypothetical protein
MVRGDWKNVMISSTARKFSDPLRGHGYNPPITEGRGGISREQVWRPGTIVNSAPSQLQTEAQLVMDRLLRECLKRRSS